MNQRISCFSVVELWSKSTLFFKVPTNFFGYIFVTNPVPHMNNNKTLPSPNTIHYFLVRATWVGTAK